MQILSHFYLNWKPNKHKEIISFFNFLNSTLKIREQTSEGCHEHFLFLKIDTKN